MALARRVGGIGVILQAGKEVVAVMVKRNSPNDIRSLDDLSRLGEIVVDKRNGKRADAKRNRRNRHYERQFIRNSLSQGLNLTEDTEEATAGETAVTEAAAVAAVAAVTAMGGLMDVRSPSNVKLSNSVQPKKLLLSKWTALQRVGKEKHFLVCKLHWPETPEEKLEWVEIEAVYSQVSRRIAWRDLKDSTLWQRGWI